MSKEKARVEVFSDAMGDYVPVDVETSAAAINYDGRNLAEVLEEFKADVLGRFERLLANAPENLDTLKEIADAIEADKDSIGTIIKTLATKADKAVVDDIVNAVDNIAVFPEGGSVGQVLKKTATGVEWGTDNNTTYGTATASDSGLMSASDKAKLNGIETGANKTDLTPYKPITVIANGGSTDGIPNDTVILELE